MRGISMTEATSNHYIPALGNIYSVVDEYAEPILRIALGGIPIPHGMQKLFGTFGGMGFAGNAALFDRIGVTPWHILGHAGGLHRVDRRHHAGAGTVHP